MKAKPSGPAHAEDAAGPPIRQRILDAAFAAFIERGFADQHARDRQEGPGFEARALRPRG